MNKTAIIYSPKYLEHNPGASHPESAERLKVIIKELERSGLLENRQTEILSPKPANEDDLRLVHRADYIELVKRVCSRGGGLLDLGDTVASTKSFKAAVYAVGGAKEAADLVMQEKFENSFALVRPPGHHALPYAACGFCIFNNVAVAVKYLIQNYGLKRVLILDIDAHHGNGIQEIFYETSNVLYVSLHQDPRGFPGVGFPDEVGKGEGEGFTVNIPFPFRTTDQFYLEGFNEIAVPIIEQYSPEFTFVSVGFDGHYADPVASLQLSANVYTHVFKELMRLFNGRFVAVLEGGYSLQWIGRLAAAAVALMAELNYVLEDAPQPANERVRNRAREFLKEVKTVQSAYWRLG